MTVTLDTVSAVVCHCDWCGFPAYRLVDPLAFVHHPNGIDIVHDECADKARKFYAGVTR